MCSLAKNFWDFSALTEVVAEFILFTATWYHNSELEALRAARAFDFQGAVEFVWFWTSPL